MGNCLVIQDRNAIKIMRMDGKILKLQSPLKVHQALAVFPPGHAISDELSVDRYLDPTADMAVGRLYRLSQAKAASPAVVEQGVVRVKMVISKQELKKMLNKEGLSLDDMVSLVHKESSGLESEHASSRGWRPALESIPEGSGF